MARRKNYFLIDLINILEKLSYFYIVYLVYLYFTNRAKFWNYSILFITVLALIIIGIIFWERKKRAKRIKMNGKWISDRAFLYWLRGISPDEFEEYIADLFNKLGFKTRKVGGGYDRGVDVVAEKDGKEHLIQCKKYFPAHQVGVADVREFYGAIADHLVNGKAYFITTSTFTLEAERFIEDKPIELWDDFELMKYVRLAEKNQ
jgi:HJR/Mrr/RecB family endonuclease